MIIRMGQGLAGGRLSRRERGGTPGLFHALGGPVGNHGSADTRLNKAALSVCVCPAAGVSEFEGRVHKQATCR